MTWFVITGLVVFAGCWWAWSSSRMVNSSFDRLFPYPDAVRWTLYVAGVVILLAGFGLHSAGNCSTDWDGVGNPTICD